MTAFDETTLPTGPELEARLKAASIAACPDAAYHGSPFRYCACGWIEEAEVTEAPAPEAEAEPSLEDKVNYIYGTLKLLEETVVPLLAQVGPLVEQAGPLLATFAPMAAKANSPMGRIFGSLL